MTQCVVRVNDKPLTIAENTTIDMLLISLDMPSGASAIAVNQEIVARELWSETQLNDGDSIALFQAIAGG